MKIIKKLRRKNDKKQVFDYYYPMRYYWTIRKHKPPQFETALIWLDLAKPLRWELDSWKPSTASFFVCFDKFIFCLECSKEIVN